MIVHCKNVETFKVTNSHSEVVGMQLFGILKSNAVIAICDQKNLYHISKNQLVILP